jgi:hypothetical protein
MLSGRPELCRKPDVCDIYEGPHECEGSELHLNARMLLTPPEVLLGHIVIRVSFPASDPFFAICS